MASEPSNTAGSPFPAQLAANVFVYEYYRMLGISPDLLFNFYEEAINEALISLNCSVPRAVARTVDAEESINGAILVVVTGYHGLLMLRGAILG